MQTPASKERVREWIDDDLVEAVEQAPDELAEFNFTLQMSGMFVHVVRRQPDSPLIVGQEIEFDDRIRRRIAEMSPVDRGELLARIRELFADTPIVYGFQDENRQNVAFSAVERIFLERRVYPDAATQQALMDAIVDVWKAMRYVNDIWSLMDAVEGEARS